MRAASRTKGSTVSGSVERSARWRLLGVGFAVIAGLCLATGLAQAQGRPALPDNISIDAVRLDAIRDVAALAFYFVVGLCVAACVIIAVLSFRHRKALASIEGLIRRESRRMIEIEDARRRAAEREAHLRATLDTMEDGVLTVDATGRVLSTNASAERMLVIEAGGLTGLNILSYIAPGDREAITAIIATLLNDQHSELAKPDETADREPIERREISGIRNTGLPAQFVISLSRIHLSGEIHCLVIISDITDRKRAQERVSEVENRLFSAINALPDGFVLYDSEDRLVMCNEKYREIYARSADLIQVGRKFEDMLRAGVARGQYASGGAEPEVWIEERMRAHLEASSVVEQQLEDGRWLRIFEQRTPEGGIVGFRVDITELKQRESALLRSENLLRSTINGAFDAIIVVDETGRIRTFNPAAEALFGFEEAEAVGTEVFELLLSETVRAQYRQGYADHLKSGFGPMLQRRTEIVCTHKDGSERLIEAAVNVSESNGERLYIANIRDIAEEKARAQALEEARDRAEVASRAKASFLAMMSHEIRTPLNGVLGLLELLGETHLSSAQASYVQTASDSGHALLEIINDILVFSKLEAGKLELEPSAESLYQLLEGVRDLLAPRAAEKQLALDLRIAPDTPDVVFIDAGRLRQVLLNLVGNALKFTDVGAVTLTLSAVTSKWGETRVRFSVEDTGIGIAKDKLPTVFAEFATLDAGYSRRYEGTGLGLAISRELVSRMGGEIMVTSELGKGSCFWFDLSLRSATAPVRRPEPAVLADTMLRRLSGLKVLLAEDNMTNQMVISEMLRGVGCEVEIAGTGVVAVERATETEFDAILMDISMPEMDGVEATAKLRASGGHNETVPIIALTAHAMAEDRVRALENRMDAFLPKPVSKHNLIQTLVRNLRSRDVDDDALPSDSDHDAPFVDAPDAHTEVPRDFDTSEIPSATAAQLDTKVLKSLLGDLPDDLRMTVLEQFDADTRQRFAEVRAGLATGDGKMVSGATHVLTSLLGTFGAMEASTRASDISETLRMGAKLEDVPDISRFLADCEKVVAEILPYRRGRDMADETDLGDRNLLQAGETR